MAQVARYQQLPVLPALALLTRERATGSEAETKPLSAGAVLGRVGQSRMELQQSLTDNDGRHRSCRMESKRNKDLIGNLVV